VWIFKISLLKMSQAMAYYRDDHKKKEMIRMVKVEVEVYRLARRASES